MTDDSLAMVNLGALLRGDDEPHYDEDGGSDDDEQTSIAGTSAGKLFGVADGADRDDESLLALGESKPAASGDAASILRAISRRFGHAARNPG